MTSWVDLDSLASRIRLACSGSSRGWAKTRLKVGSFLADRGWGLVRPPRVRLVTLALAGVPVGRRDNRPGQCRRGKWFWRRQFFRFCGWAWRYSPGRALPRLAGWSDRV